MVASTEKLESRNAIARLVSDFRTESNAVSIARLAIIVSVLTAFLAVLVAWEMAKMKGLLETELHQTRQEVLAMEDEAELKNAFLADLRAKMEAHGIEVD